MKRALRNGAWAFLGAAIWGAVMNWWPSVGGMWVDQEKTTPSGAATLLLLAVFTLHFLYTVTSTEKR